MTIDDLLQRLDRVKQTGDGWMARCPAHADGRPSLHINDRDGTILLTCFAGCTVEAIVEALDIEVRDLFTKERDWRRPTGAPVTRYLPSAYTPTPTTMPADVATWLEGRGLSADYWDADTLLEFGTAGAIQFPLTKQGRVVNVKTRYLPKGFAIEEGRELVPLGYDACLHHNGDVVLVEGEIDWMTVQEARLPDTEVITPPNGSNPSDAVVALIAEACQRARRVIFAGDMDQPGQKLIDRLAARIGFDRCYRVTWPDGCNDANDCLMAYGMETTREYLTRGIPFPVAGVFGVDDLTDALWNRFRNGPRRGMQTRWPRTNKHFTPRRGELTIVTGAPGSGKSSYIDALLLELLEVDPSLNVAVCSPEQAPLDQHLAAMIQIRSGKAFPREEVPYQRWIDEAELEEHRQWLRGRIGFVLPDDPTVEAVLEAMRVESVRRGIGYAVIDPWTELDATRPPHMTETEFIHQSLRKIRRFGLDHDCHMTVVAHPTKLRANDEGLYPVATPYDISGSAAWFNKADNCLSVWRDRGNPGSEVEVHVQKVRFREVGRLGRLAYYYDEISGRFREAT